MNFSLFMIFIKGLKIVYTELILTNFESENTVQNLFFYDGLYQKYDMVKYGSIFRTHFYHE